MSQWWNCQVVYLQLVLHVCRSCSYSFGLSFSAFSCVWTGHSTSLQNSLALYSMNPSKPIVHRLLLLATWLISVFLLRSVQRVFGVCRASECSLHQVVSVLVCFFFMIHHVFRNTPSADELLASKNLEETRWTLKEKYGIATFNLQRNVEKPLKKPTASQFQFPNAFKKNGSSKNNIIFWAWRNVQRNVAWGSEARTNRHTWQEDSSSHDQNTEAKETDKRRVLQGSPHLVEGRPNGQISEPRQLVACIESIGTSAKKKKPWNRNRSKEPLELEWQSLEVYRS